MPKVSHHPPGTFCWPELATPSPDEAKTFYSSVFGWTFRDDSVGVDGAYTVFQQQGLDVAGLYELRPEQLRQQVPTHWLPYVAVASAEAATRLAAASGATILGSRFEVRGVGEMGWLRDPTGAVLGLWEPRGRIGSELSGEPGTLCWSELVTRDPLAAKTFYTALFGWKMREAPNLWMPYTEILHGGWPVGGMIEMTSVWGATPPHWRIFIAVRDCDATLARARSLGGSSEERPIDIPGVGRFVTIEDPLGAYLSILAFDRMS